MIARLISFIGILLIFSTQAIALPAPMSSEQLLAKSDVVALVWVLRVTCTSVTHDDQTGEALPHYVATLEILKSEKGTSHPTTQSR